MKKLLFVLPLVAAAMTGCKKEYLETQPTDNVSAETVFTTTQGAYVALNGTYRTQFTSYNAGNFGQKSFDLVNDLMGNDMVVHTAGYGWFNTDYNYTAGASAASTQRSDRVWWHYYRVINNANRIIDGVKRATGTDAEKQDLKGQALGLRAHSYFNLINWFQHTYKGNENKPGVPLYTEPTTEGKPRGTVQQVYTQIIADLTEAETLLTGKTRAHISNINVNVIQGLRARVALQMEDYATAATYAVKARTGFALMNSTALVGGLSSKTNTEWIWGMEVNTEQATIYNSFFSHMDVATGGYAALGGQKKITKALYDRIPDADARKAWFTAPAAATSSRPAYNQLKFRVPTVGSWAADYLFMRSSEMYLIEAEALARTGNEAGARTALEAVVKRSNPLYTAALFTGSALVNEILTQRRIELWGEGFSYFDIKRLKQGLNRPSGTGNHGSPSFDPRVFTLADQDASFLFRIPQDELNNNKALTPNDQNP
ncbi:hypothetical protein BUE76_04945 [Cnuella takakiae]|nr:hypothetical protein BUE76_04945 [Cnuella takakiae]